MKEEEINLAEYTYNPEDTVEIPGLVLISLLAFAKQVQINEESMGLCFSYPKKTKEIKDKDFLVSVEEENLTNYSSAEAFFNQQPKMFTTLLGAGAQDVLMQLQNVHLQNIKSGLAKPKPSGEFKLDKNAAKV